MIQVKETTLHLKPVVNNASSTDSIHRAETNLVSLHFSLRLHLVQSEISELGLGLLLLFSKFFNLLDEVHLFFLEFVDLHGERDLLLILNSAVLVELFNLLVERLLLLGDRLHELSSLCLNLLRHIILLKT